MRNRCKVRIRALLTAFTYDPTTSDLAGSDQGDQPHRKHVTHTQEACLETPAALKDPSSIPHPVPETW